MVAHAAGCWVEHRRGLSTEIFWLPGGCRSGLVALEEAPEEPIYSSGPEIYRPGPRIYSPGRIRGPSAPESGRDPGAGPIDFRPGAIDRLLGGRLQSNQSGTVNLEEVGEIKLGSECCGALRPGFWDGEVIENVAQN